MILDDGEELTVVQGFLKGDRVVQPGEPRRMQIEQDGKNSELPAEHLPEPFNAPKMTTVSQPADWHCPRLPAVWPPAVCLSQPGSLCRQSLVRLNREICLY